MTHVFSSLLRELTTGHMHLSYSPESRSLTHVTVSINFIKTSKEFTLITAYSFKEFNNESIQGIILWSIYSVSIMYPAYKSKSMDFNFI